MPRPHSSLARCILALALSSSLAVSVPASAQDPAAVAAEPAIPDSTLDALRGRQVEVGRSDGSAVAGELLTFDAGNLSLIAADGQTVIVPRAEIAAVRVATSSTSPAAAPAPVVVTTPNQCLSDNQCEHPTSCVEGACIITQGYLDALEKEGTTRVKAGKWMLIGGAAATGIGAVLFGVGLGRGLVLDQQSWDCDDDRHSNCQALSDRAGSWYVASWVGVGVLSLGGLALLVGGPTYGVGKRKLKRLDQYKARVAPTAGFSRHGASLGAVLRF